MTANIPNFSPQWTSRDPADFGMTLLELFAYMGDIINYYIDRAANESFIATASQRASVLQIANLMGYIPTTNVPSTVNLTFQNSTASPITLPALTQVGTTLTANGTTTQVLFETNAAATVPAKSGAINGSIVVAATQGYTILNAPETQGPSTGLANQFYKLNLPNVIGSSIKVSINSVSYTQVQYLIDSAGYDPVFVVSTDTNNYSYISFGDGVSGRIPPVGANILVTYRIGLGSLGNVPSGTITNIISVPTFSSVPAGLTVANSANLVDTVNGAATGGADPESTDSIRYNTPLSIRSINRAVSLTDYSNLAVQVVGVAKASAVASTYSSVTLYIAPLGDAGVGGDNVTPTTTFNTIATNVLAYLVDKAPANTTVTFQPPKYVGVYLIVNITVSPQYSQSSVLANVTNAINSILYIDNVYFGETLSVATLSNTISSVQGVAYQSIKKLVRADQDQTFTISNKALTSNVATLTTSTTHNLTVGQTVLVSNVDSTFNGTVVITGVTGTTFTYTLVAANVSSTPVTVTVTGATATSTSVTYTATNTFTVGQTVYVTGITNTGPTLNLSGVITAATGANFTIATTAASGAIYTSGGVATIGVTTALTVGDILCAANELPTLYEIGTVASSSASGIGSVTINTTGGILN